MRCLDHFATRQISNRARHPQNPVHRTCRKLQTLDGLLQQILIGLAQLGARTQRRWRQMRIERATRLLPGVGGFHPCAYRSTGLTQRRTLPQLHRVHPRHADMQIDAVQQRARHPRAVAIDPFVAAQATIAAITGPAARAGIHRGHQLEPRGVLHAACRAGDADVAGLQWLAQGFQCAAVPLWKLVKEEDSMVGQ